MSQMFRCPKCKEVIRTGVPSCQYCNTTIDDSLARLEAVKFQSGIDACAAANHIKSTIYAAPFLLAVDLVLPLLRSDDFSSRPNFHLYFSLLPLGSLVAAFGWFTKYGGLQSDDPDFPEARNAAKKTLILWLILSAIHIVVMTKTYLARY